MKHHIETYIASSNDSEHRERGYALSIYKSNQRTSLTTRSFINKKFSSNLTDYIALIELLQVVKNIGENKSLDIAIAAYSDNTLLIEEIKKAKENQKALLDEFKANNVSPEKIILWKVILKLLHDRRNARIQFQIAADDHHKERIVEARQNADKAMADFRTSPLKRNIDSLTNVSKKINL